MPSHVVGVGDCAVSNDPEAVLVTYALGSCIGVAVHDPVAKVAGLLHYMLPESSLNPTKALERPYMFADTGIPLLLESACRLGAAKARLKVSVVGGAQLLDSNEIFNIGKRNHLALRRIFWKSGILVHYEDVGGTSSRTIRLEVATGQLTLRHGGTDRVLEPGGKRAGGKHGL
jgi:chemotaxis protein CheD